MTSKFQTTLTMMALLSLGAPLFGQETQDLSELLSGKTHPLTVKLKDLDADWRRITVHRGANVSGNVAVNVNGYTSSSSANNSSSASHSQNNLVGALPSSQGYVTKGQTAVANGRTYLVAYHLPAFGLDVGALLQALAAKAPPTAAALNSDTSLPLSLVDLHSVGTLDDIRVFDAQAEIADSEKSLRIASELLKSQGSGSPTNSPSAVKSGSGK